MLAFIQLWLTEQGVTSQYLTLASLFVGSVIICTLCAISFYLTRYQLLVLIEKLVQNSRNTWDDLLSENHVFSRTALLLPLLLLLFL